MNEEIKNIRLKFNCPADLDSMQTVEGGKFCDHCQKKVYDFTDAKRELFLTILAENGNNICGRFRPGQIASIPLIKLPTWKKWVSAAMVLIGINIFNQQAGAQTKKQFAAKQVKVMEDPPVNGGISPMPEPKFAGDFGQFLMKNIHYNKGMKDGRVIALFTVNTNGSLSNIKIVRSLAALNDNEVIRVLKLSPKWIPAQENNKPVAVEYAIPIKFDSSGK